MFGVRCDADIIRGLRWSDLSRSGAYDQWRDAKTRVAGQLAGAPVVEIDSFSDPGADAIAEIARRCALVNHAIYRVRRPDPAVADASAGLVGLARQFGLVVAEDHRSAAESGVVALRTSSDEARSGYIPYTSRKMNWHTDGYYNAPDQPVMGFVLHCLRQAKSGGENRILDPEIAYMRLRDENPDFVRAFMHPQAMSIPENREPNGNLRPESVGPVFFADPITGRLQMRYTARTRSIRWRDDPDTRAASDCLRALLESGDPFERQVRLAPGEGILNNNVLHNRTGFEDGAAQGDTRVILRVRFHVRVGEVNHGAA